MSLFLVALLCVSNLLHSDAISDDSFPASFDCPMRQLALEFAQEIQPWLTTKQLQDIADALNGSPEAQCRNLTVATHNNHNDHINNAYPSLLNDNELNDINANALYIDVANGFDNILTNDGSIQLPFNSLNYALSIWRNHYNRKQDTIILRKGRYYLKETVHFNALDSNLKISNYNNENAEISGAIPLKCEWELYKNGTNKNGKNYYKCNLTKHGANDNITVIQGLRVNGSRAIRARYPNANPETDGFGSTLKAKAWIGPKYPNPTPKYNVNPTYPCRNISCYDYFYYYTLGVQGTSCFNFEPSAGYWCSPNNKGGGGNIYEIPSGMQYESPSILPNAPYSNITNAVIQAWRPGHWSSWMFLVNASDYHPTNAQGSITFLKGGFQGGRGAKNGDEFYIENVFEELDYPMEWFYNESERILYYYNNISGANAIDDLLFEVTSLKVLFVYNGTKQKPINNVKLQGLTLRDTRYTFMDAHGMPSGGDWSLAKIGAVIMNGVVDSVISNCLFTRLDGNAISVNSFVRNVTIYRNEFVWNGDNVIGLWGDTVVPNSSNYSDIVPHGMGWDGYTMQEQPRYVNVSYNLVHEIGIFEKQSSLYFQAKSCLNYIGFNIFYNGPRAAVNFNDGFGGGSVIEKNLLFNTCRESGSHGPFNSWDRQPYLTKVGSDGETASSVKKWDTIRNNFIVANYQGKYAVDNDDGSCFYLTHDNFLVYGEMGLKSNFGGNSNHHFNNVYAYVGGQCFSIAQGDSDTVYQLPGFVDAFYNNTCVVFPMQIIDYGNDNMYGDFNCKESVDTWPLLGNNSIYTRNQSLVDIIGLCEMNENAFQKKYKLDLNTNVYGPKQINDTDLIQQARLLLWS